MNKYKKIALLIEKSMHSTLTESECQRLDAWKSESARNLKLYNRLSDPAYWDKVKKIDLEEAWQKVIAPRKSKSEPNSEFEIMEIIVKKIQTPLNEAEQLELDLWLSNSEENQNFYNEVISSDEI